MSNRRTTKETAAEVADKGGDVSKGGLANSLAAFSVGSLGQAVALASAVVAFVGIVVLYRFLFPPVVEEAVAADAPQAAEATPAPEGDTTPAEEQPVGVESPWTGDGRFSTGNSDLDQQVKAFCDALSNQELSAWDNAQNVYNNIVWGASADFDANVVPSGSNWDEGAAKQYFAKANAAAGETADGDIYDQAAVIAYCLRYFGMSDAKALPLYSWTTGGSGGALVLVTDGYNYERVCDPVYGADGWMLDRYMYSITVEDIGQDLSPMEVLGIPVQKQAQEQVQDTSQPEGQESYVEEEQSYAGEDQSYAGEEYYTEEEYYDYSY